MTRPEQRDTEREHIQEFLRLAGLATTSFDQPDAPDAVLTIGGRRVGVEHFRRRSDVEALAKRLATFVTSRAPALPSRITAAWLAEQGFPELISLVVDPSEQPVAIVTPAFWGPGVETVHAAVLRKETKLARYRVNVDEAWLLLVTGATWTQATDSALTEGLVVESSFDAVYLLDLRERVVQTLHERT